MNALMMLDNETVEEFFDRVMRVWKVADNNGERRPRLAKVWRARFKEYRNERRKRFHDRVQAKLEMPGAGTREKTKGKHVGKIVSALDPKTGLEMRNSEGRLIIKTTKHEPGSMGGRSSTFRSRECRDNYLREAGDNNFCHACQKRIWTDKAKVLCVDPQQVSRKYVAVICKSCSQGENIRMHTRAGHDVWDFMRRFKDSQVRAWIRFKLATLDDAKLEKFRKYVLSLSWAISPKR